MSKRHVSRAVVTTIIDNVTREHNDASRFLRLAVRFTSRCGDEPWNASQVKQSAALRALRKQSDMFGFQVGRRLLANFLRKIQWFEGGDGQVVLGFLPGHSQLVI